MPSFGKRHVMFDQWEALYIIQEEEEYHDYMREMDDLLFGDSEYDS